MSPRMLLKAALGALGLGGVAWLGLSLYSRPLAVSRRPIPVREFLSSLTAVLLDRSGRGPRDTQLLVLSAACPQLPAAVVNGVHP